MKDANFDKLYLPDPPTPINIALPLGDLNTLAILKICCIACSKNTRSYLSSEKLL